MSRIHQAVLSESLPTPPTPGESDFAVRDSPARRSCTLQGAIIRSPVPPFDLGRVSRRAPCSRGVTHVHCSYTVAVFTASNLSEALLREARCFCEGVGAEVAEVIQGSDRPNLGLLRKLKNLFG